MFDAKSSGVARAELSSLDMLPEQGFASSGIAEHMCNALLEGETRRPLR